MPLDAGPVLCGATGNIGAMWVLTVQSTLHITNQGNTAHRRHQKQTNKQTKKLQNE